MSAVTIQHENQSIFYDLCARMVRKRNTRVFFQTAIQMVRGFKDFEGDWTEEECEEFKQFVAGILTEDLAQAIRDNVKHCGQSVYVKAEYDIEKKQYLILVRCDRCGQYSTIES